MHEPYDPGRHGTYGAYLRGKGIQIQGSVSQPVRREHLDEGGRRRREVTHMTDSGAVATVTNRTDTRGDHQDVTVETPVLRQSARFPAGAGAGAGA